MKMDGFAREVDATGRRLTVKTKGEFALFSFCAASAEFSLDVSAKLGGSLRLRCCTCGPMDTSPSAFGPRFVTHSGV